MKRWRADTASVLGEVLGRIFADRGALAQGRVFVNRARVQDATMAVPAGALVEVGDAVAATSGELEILHVEPGFVAVNKPADLASVPDHHGHDSLQARVAAYCNLPLDRVHPTSRLDRGVSGVVVFALAKGARDAFAQARDNGTYTRRYLAIAAVAPAEPGTWSWAIGRHPKDPRKRAVHGKDATHASTDHRVRARAAHGVLLELTPHTGRTHQLRVHASHAGAPLDGDTTYGGRTRLTSDRGDITTLKRVALHAARVVVPWQGDRIELAAAVPSALREWWKALGGEPHELGVQRAPGGGGGAP